MKKKDAVSWAEFIKEEYKISEENKQLQLTPITKKTQWKLTLFAEKKETIDGNEINNKKNICNIL